MLSPGSARQALEALVVVTLEGLSPLLHDLSLIHGSQLGHFNRDIDGGAVYSPLPTMEMSGCNSAILPIYFTIHIL